MGHFKVQTIGLGISKEYQTKHPKCKIDFEFQSGNSLVLFVPYLLVYE